MRPIKYFLIFIFFTLVGFGGLYTYLSSNPQIKINSLKEIFKGSKFSLLVAPKLSLKGEIKNMSGEVLWQGRVSDKPEKIKTLSNVQQGEAIETGTDGQIEIDFLNSANLILNKNSKVEFGQTLPANLVFIQSKGSVDYKKLSSLPVSVRSKLLLIEILGNVNINVIENTDLIEITGESKIAYNNNANVTKLVNINNGETLVFNSDTLKVDSK